MVRRLAVPAVPLLVAVALGLVTPTWPAAAAGPQPGAAAAGKASAAPVALAVCPDPFEDDDAAALARPIALGRCELRNHCDDGSDWLSFTGIPGQPLVVATCNQGLDSDTVVRVYDPGLAPLVEDDDGGSCDLRSSSARFTPGVAGTHYAEVRPYDGQGGADRDYLVCLRQGCREADPYEQDDDALTARPIGVGDCQVHDHCDDNDDWLRLELEAGELYTLETCNLGADSDTVLELRDPSLALVAAADDGGPCDPLASVLVYRAASTGTHYLRVAQRSGLTGAGLDYRLCVAAGCTLADGYEPDDGAPQAATIGAGDCQDHNHCDDASDWLRFDAAAGESFLVETCDLGPSSDTRVRVYGPALDLLGEDDDSGACGSGSAAFLFTAADPGTHYVEVTNFDGAAGAERDYQVCLSGGCASPDPFEPDDDLASARAIAAGDCQDRNHCDDRSDWLAADLVAGSTYTARACNVGTAGDVALALFDPALNPVREDDNGGGCDPAAAGIAFTAGVTGRHYLVVSQAASAIGPDRDYRLCLLAGCQLADLTEDDDDPAEAGAIAVDECQQHNHCDDGADWLAFPATAGQALRVETCNLGAASDTRVLVHGPDLAVLAQDDDSGPCDPGASAVTFTALETGRHYLEVVQEDGGAGPDRDYSLCLLASCLGPDAYEDDDGAASARPIAAGECQRHDHCDDGADWLAIAAAAGGTYTVRTCNLGAAGDTVLTLFDPSLAPVASDDDGGACDQLASAIVFTATETGIYYLEIGQADQGFGSRRDYQVCLSSGSLVATLLRNDSVASLSPVEPPLATVLPLDPARDAHLAGVAPGALDPTPPKFAPLVFYGLDLPLGTLKLVKEPGDAIAVWF